MFVLRNVGTVGLPVLVGLMVGCGSRVVPYVEKKTEVFVDAAPQISEVTPDAGTGADTETATSGMPKKSVPEEPVAIPRFVMQGGGLEGPFETSAGACRWLKDNSMGKCLKKKNGWNRKKYLGERGELLAAMPLRVKLMGEKEKQGAEACAILIKTSKGWWLQGHREVCWFKDELEEDPFYTDLHQFTYADDLSFGVLLAKRGGERLAKRSYTRNGKEFVSELWVSQSEIMYCAANNEGVPRCSDWQVTSCNANERYVEHKNGEIVVTEGRPTRSVGAERMLLPGIYTLFEEGFHQKGGGLVSTEYSEEQKPLETVSMFGPFSSVKAYCNTLPHDSELEDSEYEYESGGAETKPPRCAMGRKGWSGVQPNGGLGGIQAARLLRVKASMAGAPIEYCHVAIKTSRGWFLSAESYHCQGVLGPSTTAKTVTRHVRWVGNEDSPALAVVYEHSLTHTEYGGGCYEEFASGGSCGQEESQFTDRFAHLKLCGMGSSEIPSCSGVISIGCPFPHGKKVYKAWSYDGKRFELTGPDELREDCESLSEIEPGPHELSFP